MHDCSYAHLTKFSVLKGVVLLLWYQMISLLEKPENLTKTVNLTKRVA